MKRLVLVGVLALPVLAAACSDTPVAPQVRPQFTTDALLSRVAKYKSGGPPTTSTYASQVIGALGGRVSLGDFEIIVPPGAVLLPTRFSITLPADEKKKSYALAEFGPHGARFIIPVTITLPYRGTTAEGNTAIHALWNSGLDWIMIPSWITLDGRVRAITNHFSEYGTEENPNRGITAAGG